MNSSILAEPILLSGFSSGNFTDLPAGFALTFIAAAFTTLVIPAAHRFDIIRNSEPFSVPPETCGFFFPLYNTTFTLRARSAMPFLDYFAFELPTDCYESYISTKADDRLRIRPLRDEAENKQICFLHFFFGSGTVNLSIPSPFSRITVLHLASSIRYISESAESEILKKRTLPLLFTILIGLHERGVLKIALKMKQSEPSPFIRIRIVRNEAENHGDVVPLLNLSAYSLPTEEDVIDVRFANLKAANEQIGDEHQSPDLNGSVDGSDNAHKNSGRYIIETATIGVAILMVLGGIYGFYFIRSKRVVRKGVLGQVERKSLSRTEDPLHSHTEHVPLTRDSHPRQQLF
jgi:hypothetical protein